MKERRESWFSKHTLQRVFHEVKDENLTAYTALTQVAEANFMPSIIEQNRKKF